AREGTRPAVNSELETRNPELSSSAEAFAAGASRGGVGIFHLEPAILQRLDVVEFAPGHVERALRVHDHADAARFDQDVATGRSILKIHLVLQPRAAAADHRHAQHARGPALPAEQRM